MNTILSTPRRLVMALVAAGAIGALGATGAGLVGTRSAAQATESAVAAQPTALNLPAVNAPNFADITARNGAAVVNISVVGSSRAMSDDEGDPTSERQQQGPGISPDDPFFEFFRQFGIPGMPGGQGMGPRAQQPDTPMRGQGSGFIVSSDGVILTNAHVVHGAKEVTVKLNDRREFRAKVLGADPRTDVAVLKIDASGLPTVKLGQTSQLRVGDWVLAIGSPFGFENSVTAGVVSAKGRSLPDDSFVPFLQTDVAINPGNSGGPLFNAQGEVVGINSQIYTRSGGYQGVSFAIPIELATRVQQQIQATGKAQHAKLGVSVQEVNQAFADSFKLDKPEGALVASVEKNGPAATAGLEPGDVVRKVDGKPIVGSGDLPAFIGQALPGQKVTLEVWRKGESKTLSATLGDASDKSVKVASSPSDGDKGKLGLALRPLQPEEKRQIGVDSGLLVAQASGPAAAAGISRGDVLLSINGAPAGNIDEVRAAVARADKTVAVLIWRDGNKIFVPVRLG
ncbi:MULTISPECIES: Do family serine endopeptidase [Comamonas]|uniref:Do family serine endopeptidase n=1 Tax=Comamonas TaxID=283 RepID=UPI0012C602DA|nr:MULTISPECIES: Do family serine endopeptidase [Comamonas]MDR3065227.1 Do family serine endopeptidase [Comamonas sp.]MEB5963634.1 Do family serine endopeptidase [Comamonas testosteroni]MPS94195.1 Do family serine endopeptidase [Comamonas sp.]